MKYLCWAILLLAATSVFAAYPDEYPIYLRMLGFTKSEIYNLQFGESVFHPVKDTRPGEYGISAARVFDVPGYFIRDYYSYIENFRSLQNFQMVGKFSETPVMQDVMPLMLNAAELSELSACRQQCALNLTQEEISGLKADTNLQQYFRNILLNRLLEYQTKMDHSKNYLQDFDYLRAYFPGVIQYLSRYPGTRNQHVPEFFFWMKEKIGDEDVIEIHHVYSERIGDDFVIVNNLVYSNHLLMASAAVIHLINYVDRGFPRTLLVYYGRNYVEPEFNKAAKLDRRIFTAFEMAGKELERRYINPEFPHFPYGLVPTDQR
jgi:hypothetical protein